MLQTVACTTDRRRLKAPFRISRGVKTEIETVRVTIAREGVAGVGAATPYPRYGESAASAAAQVESIRRELEAGLGRRRLLDLLPPGAARNAVDCALWDLEARSAGVGVADLIGAARPRRCETAMTVSLDTPGRMEAAAARLAGAPLLKVKVDGRDPEGQIAAVRRVAPAPRLIVDPNEGWDFATLKALQPCLREARVDLVEQPLPAAADEVLVGWRPLVPMCADESFHEAGDLDRVAARYQCVNIKLDKCGGLTHALELLAGARRRGLSVMAGCMVCTSLAIAPALLLAAMGVEFIDLDGPLWLADDDAGGVSGADGFLDPPAPDLWSL